MKPKVSVIIPIYNVDKYLPKCIDSVLAQNYKDFELILVDDGSTDECPAICDGYSQKDSRVIVIHQKNSGVSVARNTGIYKAKGEWITFIDSDDWVDPDYLANFGLDDADGIDLIIQGMEYYDQRIDKFYSKWSFNSCTLQEENFIQGFAEHRLLEVGFPVCKVYRTELLMNNDLRFDFRISYHEDHIFVLDYYMLCHTIRLVDATDYKYRCYHTGTSLSSKHHSWEKMNLAGDEMLKRIEAMKGKFCEEGSESAKRILTFAYDCKMTAAETIVLSKAPYFTKCQQFKTVIDKRQIGECYFPNSSRNKLTKFIYQYLTFSCAYFYHDTIQLLKKLK